MSGDGSTFVAWCGLLINTANLELQADYTRYAGVQLASTLTVPLAKVLDVARSTDSNSPLHGVVCLHIFLPCLICSSQLSMRLLVCTYSQHL